MRAARHCQTSMYASIAGLIFLVVPMIPGASLAGAIVAIVFGCMGIAGLNKVGRGPSNLSDVSAYERVSVRTARRARPQATAGIAIGAVVLCLFGGALFMKVQEERKRERSQREFLQHFQERMREHNERLNRGKTIGEDLERELDEIEQEFEGDDR